ncbi:MAG: Fur family transcriptional regulator [Blastocatellia bacterium]|jgi:Fur family peroxide stress response transcriptional regulator
MARLDYKTVAAMVDGYGLKMTPQRRAIVEYLQTCTDHPTADEVLTAVNDKFPMTSRPTVYNTLNWLKGSGLVNEVYEGGAVRYDPNTSPHHHFVCRRCGIVEDIDSESVGEVSIGPLPGFQKIENFQVTIRGICLKCQ